MIFAAIPIDFDPNLAKLGPFLVTWHGIFSVLGILAAVRMGAWLAGRDGIAADRIYDLAVWMVVAGLIGARLLYVWENYEQFIGQWQRVIYLNEGGISQWGGLFGAIGGVYLWARRAGVSFWKVMDACGAAALIGLAVGRIGDIINGEHHGSPTSLPWGVRYTHVVYTPQGDIDVAHSTLGEPNRVVHPEVAYEMLLCLILLAIFLPLHSRLKSRLPDGVAGLLALAVYAGGRFLLSFLRLDSIAFGLRQAQWASLAMIVFAVAASIVLLRRARAPRPPVEAVDPG